MNHPSTTGAWKLWHKFLVLGLLSIVLASIPSYFYFAEAAKGLNAYESEQQGLPRVQAGFKLVQLAQQHRGLSALALGGVAGAPEKRAAKQAEVDSAVEKLDVIVKAIDDRTVEAAWSEPKRDWQALRAGLASNSITVPQSFTAHSALIPKLLKLNDLIADFYGLNRDPDTDTDHLIQAMYYQLPYLTEELGKTRAKGTGLLAKQAAADDDRQMLSSIIARVVDRLDQSTTAFNKAVAANPSFQSTLGPAMSGATAAANKLAALARDQIIMADTLNYSPEAYLNTATDAIDLQFKLNAAASQQLDSLLTDKIAQFHRARALMLAAMFGLMAGVAFIGFRVSRSITGPLNHAIAIAQSVAQGNLASDFEVGPPNEVGQLLRALKAMSESLREMVGEVRTSIHTIGAATRDIASGNADISARLESQASNLEETASSMEELISTVRQNADNAQQANTLVIGASGAAMKGGNVVSQVMATMGEINESSRKIVDIIAVIDGIAFQTNILALNAAVEAARAGEQGRGFAVVAGEVRNLAQRSGAAAKQIKDLIGSSVDKVAIGNKLADDAGLAMGEIVTSVKRITQIMTEITAASNEQGAGIEQVNQAVTEMDDMTQRNAALVEQTAAASASLDEQATSLIQSMSIFKLGNEERQPRLASNADRLRLQG
ncbi:MAG: methyl-accepting chemotaxis protein [Massilia sp.]